jgi:hypothetical protein
MPPSKETKEYAMSTPQPSRPDPRTQREREEERRRKEKQPDEQPSQPRKPEVDLPQHDDGVTEEKWNRTPRR